MWELMMDNKINKTFVDNYDRFEYRKPEMFVIDSFDRVVDKIDLNPQVRPGDKDINRVMEPKEVEN